MRLFHFFNSPIDPRHLVSGGDDLSGAGGWLTSLVRRQLDVPDLRLACASFGNVRSLQRQSHDRLDSFVIPGSADWTGPRLQRSLEACRAVVADWKPDLVHVHGTESAYGLLSARGLLDVPVVISIQGLLGPCAEWYHYFGKAGLLDVIRMHRPLELVALRGQLVEYVRFQQKAAREREILAKNRYFVGRTEWDRAHVLAANPGATYFHGGELLRDAFWHRRWRLQDARRHRLVFTNAGRPRKGTEIIFEALDLLRGRYPDVQVAIAGVISRRSGYGRHIRRMLAAAGPAAVELGELNAVQMADELARSHVFVSPSYIDNSPNAVCEAQLMGMPVVSSYTGGVPSLVEHGRTGLSFPTGDAPMLAAQVARLFDDDAWALALGDQARAVAAVRHEPQAVLHELLGVYEAVLGLHRNG